MSTDDEAFDSLYLLFYFYIIYGWLLPITLSCYALPLAYGEIIRFLINLGWFL